MPLRNPQDFSLSLSFGSYQKVCWRLRVLRRRSQSPASYCKQAIVSHFIPRRASTCFTRKTYTLFVHLSTAVTTRGGGQNKSVCHANPSWACAYAPKMEDACESTSPDGSQKSRREIGRSRRERPSAQCLRPCEARCSRLANKQTCDFGLPKSVFLATSCRAARSSIKCRTAHAQRCVRVKRRSSRNFSQTNISLPPSKKTPCTSHANML